MCWPDKMTKDSIEFLEHTGDTGLYVRAETLEQLFISSAIGMFRIICPDFISSNVLKREIVLQCENLPELFISWLSELNFWFCTDQELYGKFEIEQLKNNKLRAQVFGEKVDQNKHKIHTEIKAVTYHQLSVKHSIDAWEARVIFDV